jgi:hypothetical protein
MLTLLLAEVKGNMDLAASPGGSGTSFVPRKLYILKLWNGTNIQVFLIAG